jgi:hypothetical protein
MNNAVSKIVGKRIFLAMSYFERSNGLVNKSLFNFNTVKVMPKATKNKIY